jgi:transposase
MAAAGMGNDEIAARLDTRREVVSKWRKRFFEQGLGGLEERPRGGRPPVFSPEVVVAVKALACELPSRLEVPLSRLYVPDIASEAVSRGIVAKISGKTVWRWLSEDAIKPWRRRSWIFARDPDFEAKAGRVLDLYAREWKGKALTDDDYVVSSNEETSTRARARRHPGLAPAPGRDMRVES